MAKAAVQAILKRPIPIFYGWWIVAVSLVIDACKHGTFNRGFTLYILPHPKRIGPQCDGDLTGGDVWSAGGWCVGPDHGLSHRPFWGWRHSGVWWPHVGA